ncbi:MAG: efflux RND transporter permease subunit [Gemmatimonadaceae bacterium]
MIRWAVHRPAVIWAATAALLLAGGVAFTRLPLATKTTVELPRLQVSASWQGASAEVVEMYLTSPIESAIQGVRDVRRTSSESRDGGAFITVELEPRADVQIARLGILERIELLRPEFPPGVTPPRVGNYVPEELEEAPLIRATLSGPYTPGALQRIANERVTPRIGSVAGVAGVSVQGGTELGVSVTYDARLLRQLGLSPAILSDALRSARLVQAVGTERFGSAQRGVIIRDQPSAVERLADLPIRGAGNRVFRLGDLASVRPEEDARGQFFRINGQPAIALTVTRLPGADAIKTAAAIRQAFDAIGPALPTGIEVTITSDDSIDLRDQMNDLLRRGGIAFLAVMVVVAVSYRRAAPVALVLGSAAVSIAGTALSLYLLHIPANLLTLAGLGMGVGILVQNGLVVVQYLGQDPGAREGSAEGRARAGRRILPAVLGSTLTTMVVLVPFLYLQGNARAAFMPFAAAFGLALAWSVLSAVIMVPALGTGQSLRAREWPRLRRAYAGYLVRMLRWRRSVLVATTLVLAGVTWGFFKRVERFRWGGGYGEQRTSVQASIGFPRGSDPVTLERAIRELEEIAVGHPGVEQVIAQSRGDFGAGINVLFTRAAGYTGYPQGLEELLTQRAALIGGASVSVRGQGPGFSSGSGRVGGSNQRIKILGYSFGGVGQLALDLKGRLERIPRVREVDVNSSSFFSQEKSYAVTLEPDRGALARYGVTASQFRDAVAREVRGPVGLQRIEIAGEEIPVTLKAAGARDRTLDELREALVPTSGGAPARVGDLSAVGEREGLSTISREDQQYVRIVSYGFRGPAKLAQRTHESFMMSVTVPAGSVVGDAGFDWGYVDDSDRGLWLVFGVGVILVVLAVAMVFDSVWAAAMVLLSIPLALAGVMAAFWIAKTPFTREAAVGVILVVGLAVHQGILLVDAALERRRARAARGGRATLRARDVTDAALERAAMIVLVTLSTLASLIPLAIGTATGSLFGAIALATAGGTVAGTVGAMLVLPAMLMGRQTRGGA